MRERACPTCGAALEVEGAACAACRVEAAPTRAGAHSRPPAGRGTRTLIPSRDAALAAQLSHPCGEPLAFDVDVHWPERDLGADEVPAQP